MTNRNFNNLFRTPVAFLLLATTLASTAGAQAAEELRIDHSIISSAIADNAVLLRERALLDNLSVDIVESLTTEVGPRRIGTDGDKRVIEWSQAKFRELGFDRVWARAEILSPYPHNIVMTALGYSVGTEGDLVGELVEFKSLEDLEAVPEGDSLKGKIAFVSYSMSDYVPEPGQSEFAGYGLGTRARGRGHVVAAKRGAEAIIIRSVGTDNNRYAHTGSGYGYVEDVKKIPAAAVSAPDAILIQNMMKRGEPVTVKMNLTSEITGPEKSANIIGEITGREGSDNYLVLAAHVDSWDEGTGAIDDGAGVASMMAAAALIGQMEQQPRRSIRVVLFAGEEIGFYGVNVYMEEHEDDVGEHLLGAEVDGGGGRIHTLTSGVGEQSVPVVHEMYKLIAPLGIAWSDSNDARGASDISVLGNAGMPVLDFSQNSNDYFDYHHTPNDTFDKIVPEDMRYLTAAYATIFYMAAEMDVDFRQ